MTTSSAVITKKPTSTLTMSGEGIDAKHSITTERLIQADRCERCRAQAFVRAVKKDDASVSWLLCGYHGRSNLEALIAQGYAIDDQTHNIS